MRKTSAWPLSQLCVALIVYASLYPFEHWRDQDIAPWAFLSAPWPKYWTGFDVGANVLGYAPLGFFVCLSAMRLAWPGRPLVWAMGLSALLSFTMEGLQSYLPARVPSQVDFLLNVLGATGGAVLAGALERVGQLQRWGRFRSRWFVRDAHGPLVLMAVWPVALLFPVAVPFGLGQIWERLEDALTSTFGGTPFEVWVPMRAFELEPLLPGAELLCVMLGWVIPCLLGFGVIREWGQRLRYSLWVLAMSLCMSALSAALTYGPSHAWDWIGPPVLKGWLLAALVLGLLLRAPARLCLVLALVAVVWQLTLLNQASASAYFALTLQNWEQGRFIRFHGLIQWLGWLWPFALLAHLVRRLSRPQF